MGYTVSTSSSLSQPEAAANGTPATFTFNLTRDAGDAVNAQDYFWRIISPTDGQSGSDLALDFTTGAAANGNSALDGQFTWTVGQTTTNFTITATSTQPTENTESFRIYFYIGTSPNGVAILNASNTSPMTFDFTLTNVVAPTFSSTATYSAAENQLAVGTAAAAGTGAITYGFGGGVDDNLFNIDASTGVITFKLAPDFETPNDDGGNRVYDIIVSASAGGQTATKAITVNLTNVNDVTPDINSYAAVATHPINVAENTTTAFAQVTALDSETGFGDRLTYSISGGADAAKFTIDPTTGELAFASAPNFEVKTDANNDGVYDVIVQVRDTGGLTDNQAFAVTVTDQPENARFTSGAGAAITFLSAPENTLITTTLTTFVAVDDDAGSGAIAYTLGGADALDFTLTPGGVLTFSASPNFEEPADADGDNTYVITVTAEATGGGGPTTQTVYVFVTNVIEPGVATDIVVTGGGGGGGGGGTPPNPFQGTAGNDNLPGTDGDDLRQGGAGDDTIDGGAGNDLLDGDDGADYILGGSGNDFIRGLNGNDIVSGGDGSDTVNGNMGEDTVYGDLGDDQVMGGQGNDVVFGGEGNDFHVNGNMGEDLVYGGNGEDTVYGGQGNDTIYGEAGNDRLSGDLGFDILYGGAGADRFVIARGMSFDWVADFNAGEGDRIVLAVGQSYTVTTESGQTVIDLGNGDKLGLAGVTTFSADWIVFGG